MISMFKRFINEHRGNVVIEMAVISPVLVFMGLGAFDFGMAYSVQTSYEAAVRAGFEYAFTSSDLTEIAARVTANLDATSLEANYPAVTKVCECAGNPGVALSSCSTTCSGTITTPYEYINIKVRGKHALAFDWPFVSGSNIYLEQEGRIRVK